jgi:hypothetical protein
MSAKSLNVAEQSCEKFLLGDDHVDEKQKAWQQQFASNIGAVELLRFAGAFMLWLLIGMGVAILFLRSPVLSTTIFISFLLSTVVFGVVGTRWRPAYLLLRVIFGNQSLPKEPFPGPIQRAQREPRPWWAYLPGLWNLLLALALLYVVIRYLSR